MEENLRLLIANENKFNPYTDDNLALMLKTSRQNIIKIRKQLNIPSYNLRRLPYLKDKIREFISEEKNISDRKLVKSIQNLGFDISTFSVSIIRKELGEIEEIDENTQPNDNDVFCHIIGFNGSIFPKIMQAKAAILYPPNGLHTLIIGQTGTGKSQLAMAMFEFAKSIERVKPKSLIRFNCADYSNNPQLLLSQLFGHVKGAYTGAETEKKGLIEKADGGIIFLDEIHRLPVEGQEMLFSIIDNGVFRKLGESENEHKVNVMVIGATTKDLDSQLALTFRRRIPMVIELPPLYNRSINEKYEIIVEFFRMEAERLGIPINVKSDVVCGLLCYNCPGNIGQLRSDIQMACAKAYLKYVNENKKCITIGLAEFNNDVCESLYRKKYTYSGIKNYINNGISIQPGRKEVDIYDDTDSYILPNEIYGFIDQRFEELKRQGVEQNTIGKIMERELETHLKRTTSYLQKININMETKNISCLVGNEISSIVAKMSEIAEKRLGPLDKSFYYCLALHLHATIQRVKQSKPIFNPELSRIKEEYHDEYLTAIEILRVAEEKLQIKFPESETGFIALYLRKKAINLKSPNGIVNIIIISHGHVASEMAKTVNNLIGQNFVEFVDIDFEEKTDTSLKRSIELCERIHMGNGILILVDMGSAITFGELITKATNIPTRTINKVHTAMALDAAFTAINQNMTLEDLYMTLDNQSCYFKPKTNNGQPVLITLCITGEGAAQQIKKFIENNFKEEIRQSNIEIIPICFIKYWDAINAIKKIQEENFLIGIIGTIDPDISNVPFLSIDKIFEEKGETLLRNLLFAGQNEYLVKTSIPVLNQIFDDKLILPRATFKSKNVVLDELSQLLLKYGYVQKGYLLGIYERERMDNTYLTGTIAIPHTFAKHVIKPGIAIATLQKPINWGNDQFVDKIFMIALPEASSLVFRFFYQVWADQNLMEKLMSCTDRHEFINHILERK
ncbi:sigma 54-interacting transcriptional regulator [Propionispira raffinosivorans]|uniref:sigma 54-interacting transcriptional regulator n=1 Tax=Propionispira raffinosivorans TaxID=86959 RepID=UPI00035D3AAE|nr:sigma 54-interacting transcriptional regulator [Propionispira raffinosivorans]